MHFLLESGRSFCLNMMNVPRFMTNNSLFILIFVCILSPNLLFANGDGELHSLYIAIPFAFVGGIILNAMPCIFPILSLKALSIVTLAKTNISLIRKQSWAFTAGVSVSFLILSLILIILQKSSTLIGWGFQFQSTTFVCIMIYLTFLIGLNFSGLYEFPSISFVLSESKSKIAESFITGIFATLIATPCTAPFMAPAVGFALTQSPMVILLVFQSLALGFSFPYLLICHTTFLLQIFPKPGQWMIILKEFLAFPMYFTALWLLWVLSSQSGQLQATIVLAGLILMVFSIWSYNCIRNFSYIKLLLVPLLYVISLYPIYSIYNIDNTEKYELYQTFSNESLQKHLKSNHRILVVATAEWCLMCKFNQFGILNTENVIGKMKELGVIYMNADWTNRNEEITKYLATFKSKSVPLYVLYCKNGVTKRLPQILSEDLVISELNKC